MKLKPTLVGESRHIEEVAARVTLWLLVFFSVIAMAAIFLLRPMAAHANTALIALPVAVAIACLVAFVLAKRGWPRVGAGIVMTVTYVATVHYMIVTGLGLHSHATGLLAILIVVTALLVGYRAGAWAAGIAIATVIVMYLVELNGWAIDLDAVRNLKAVNILATYCILFGATGAILYLFSKAWRDALRAASDQEQRFRDLIDLAPFGYVMHRNGQVLMVNRAAAAASGLDSTEQVNGMSIYDLLPAQQREFASTRVAAVENALPGSEAPAEYRFKSKRGRDRLVEALTLPLTLADGPALLTVMRDVTRERQTTAALAVAKEQAEAASQAKSQFLANMSHEIRTPLNGVLGMADLLQTTALGEEQRRYCNAIESSGRALRDLIGNILDLAKIEAGKVELEREDFELNRLLEELVAAYRELAAARGSTFQATFDLPEYARLAGDSLRLRQVLTNLLGNAIKFTENGWIELAAQALAFRPGDARRWVRFTVRDSGIGMSGETVGRLFQPFNQADSSTTRQYGGTGLGLTIAKHLVTLMGGTISVESTPGAGSEFCVELPFESVHIPDRAVSPDMPAQAVDSPLAVLLVEDNEINQDVACAMLRKAGHRVEVAADGAEGLNKYLKGHFDVVLMDCQMPIMDGFETTRRIRAHETATGAARMPIVALTANAMSGDRERCMAAGMDDFLPKPFDSAALLAALSRRPPRLANDAAPDAVVVSFDEAIFGQLVALDRETPGLLAKLVTRFLDSTPALIDSVESTSAETAVVAGRSAHTLRSTFARFGAASLARLATDAEAAIRAGNLETARTLGAAMRPEFARVAALIEQHPALKSDTGITK
jgi:PAS domain S-box-containing protein